MKKLFTLVVALIALLAVACENNKPENGGAISITSSTEVTIGKYATEFEISYKADTEAEVTLTAEWLRVRHHDEGTVTIQVEDNETGGTRMAAVTLAVGSERATVVVNQLGVAEEPTITLTTGDTIDIKRTGCKVKIEYTIENSNPVDYVFVKCDADWIYSMDTQTEGVVELGVATNTS
ncbi:MAG: BACON domain-containing protein, partial [Alistipes sp.]|nr:BACON domain-containing protein [Alistipes sp.]